mgnify:CR=1 FL=1
MRFSTMNTHTAHIQTPLGIARVVSDDVGILEISVLEEKRSDYIKYNKKTDSDDFGSVLLKNVKQQAQNKGFVFKK